MVLINLSGYICIWDFQRNTGRIGGRGGGYVLNCRNMNVEIALSFSFATRFFNIMATKKIKLETINIIHIFGLIK